MTESVFPRERTGFSKKIIRIPPPSIKQIGIPVLNNDGTTKIDGVMAHQDLFLKHGYHFEEGPFDPRNRFEFGVGVGIHCDDEHARNREIARKAGLRMPSELTAEEVLTQKGRVMAKFTGFHGSQCKYRLDNSFQIAKFISAHLFYYALREHLFIDHCGNVFVKENYLPYVGLMLKHTIDGTKFVDFVKQGGDEFPKLDGVVFQRFIDTASSHDSSYRILADGLGNIHYIALLFARYQKEDMVLTTEKLVKKLEKPAIDQIFSNPRTVLQLLFTQTTSPFYLNLAAAISYHEDSEEIILSGQKIDEPDLRKVLIEHGIDPNHAKPPVALIDYGRRLGSAFREYAPLGGFDILQSRGWNYYFLEGNDGPDIASSGLDIQQNMSNDELERVVINRMLSNTN